MNDLISAIYWIDVLSNVSGALLGGFFLGLAGGIGGICLRDMVTDHPPRASSFLIGFIPTFLICIALNFIPSKQTMYVMLGMKTTDKVLQSDVGQKLQVIVNTQLDELVEKYGVKKK